MTNIGRDAVMERELFAIAVSDFGALPSSFTFPSQHFAALLVADTTNEPVATLSTFAETLLRSGCSFFCAWGPGCERAHDIFDECCQDTPSVIMTTWHSDEPLDEALWYFLRVAFPDDAYSDTTRSALAVTVGHSDWAAQVDRRLRDIPSLVDDVVQEI